MHHTHYRGWASSGVWARPWISTQGPSRPFLNLIASMGVSSIQLGPRCWSMALITNEADLRPPPSTLGTQQRLFDIQRNCESLKQRFLFICTDSASFDSLGCLGSTYTHLHSTPPKPRSWHRHVVAHPICRHTVMSAMHYMFLNKYCCNSIGLHMRR